MSSDELREAAGFVLYRRSEHGPLILLLRNARHGDWGFPKGHRDGDETLEACARRELLEETGLSEIRVLPDFHRVERYRVGGAAGWDKEVHYWLAELESGELVRSDEHDEVVWESASQASKRLRHESLRRLLDAANPRDGELRCPCSA